jgi:hypothetical protein
MLVKRQVICGLRIADCGFVQSKPKSEIRNPKLRTALSLTEVLISMGILTLGLLGVASVFPVGSFYMQKAEISDKASAIAQSVMNDIMARGMLNPQSWLAMVPNPPSTTANSPNLMFSGVDGKYAPVAQPDPTTGSSKTTTLFARPFAEALAEGLKRSTDPVVLAKQFGSAFVIDPMYAAAAAGTKPNSNYVIASPFPATAYYPWGYYPTAAWNAWRNAEQTWPIRRVTFQQASGWPLDKTMAESLFRGNDDLSVEFPTRDDRPGIQTWDTNTSATGSTVPLARKWAGDYSWIVSVVPTTNAARDGMVRNPEGFAYDVSVVVFYKRILPTGPPPTNSEMLDAAATERMVGAKIISTGLNGGEILLTDMGDIKDISPFDHLKSGQWIMLCGPHPSSNVDTTKTPALGEPRFVLNWYQVVSVEGKETRLNAQGTDYPVPPANDPARRLVTVRGTQWPWQPRLTYPSAQQNSDVAKLSDDLCVGIFRSAAAVHTKTIRLEGPSAAGSAALMIPNAVTPPSYNTR